MKILTIPGALRKGSYNRMLIALANEALAHSGIDADAIDLKEFPMPPYDGDLEDAEGLPDTASKLQSRIAAADGIILASPEYNSGIPGTLKNVIDWTTRGSNPWSGKVVGLMGATPNEWGTTRMMPSLRQVFSNLGALVIPQQVNIRRAGEVWNDAGELLDEKTRERVHKFVGKFLEYTTRLRPDAT